MGNCKTFLIENMHFNSLMDAQFMFKSTNIYFAFNDSNRQKPELEIVGSLWKHIQMKFNLINQHLMGGNKRMEINSC